MDDITYRAVAAGGNPAVVRLANAAAPQLKRLWTDLTEHGGNAASLVSPEAAELLNGASAISSAVTLVVSFSYAIWALSRFLKSKSK